MPTPRPKPDCDATYDIRLDEGGVFLAQGIRARQNPNGIVYMELHYSADPEKRTEEWIEREKGGNPSINWQREYELTWRASLGAPVYKGIFNAEAHVARGLPYDKDRKLIVAWDFGRDPCATFHQLTKDGRWFMLGECLAPERMAVESFMPYYFAYLDDRFGRPQRPITHVADPSGWASGLSSEKGSLDVLRASGIHPIKGEKEFSKRIESVTWWLNQSPGGKPRFQIDEAACPMTLEGFRSGYQYPRVKGTDALHHLPLKNEYSHPHDTVQYAALALHLQSKGEEIERQMKRKPEPPPSVFRRTR